MKMPLTGSSNPKRVIWTAGHVISIQIRDDLFSLAQMFKSPYLVFFNTFSVDNQWNSIDLANEQILFFRGVTRQFLKCAPIEKQKNIAARTITEYPYRWLRSGPGSQRLTLWPGTPDEMEVVTLGEEGFKVVEKDIFAEGFNQEVGISPYLKGPSHRELDVYEVDGLGVYPETTERLYLCHKFGMNVDPDKDLISGRSLPREYVSYFQAITR